MVNFENDEYQMVTAKTIKEDEELLRAGFIVCHRKKQSQNPQKT